MVFERVADDTLVPSDQYYKLFNERKIGKVVFDMTL
jgi:hypothetical protein